MASATKRVRDLPVAATVGNAGLEIGQGDAPGTSRQIPPLFLEAYSRSDVISRSVIIPPPVPSEGDRYIVPEGAQGQWADEVGQVAIWLLVTNGNAQSVGQWFFCEASGIQYVADEDTVITFGNEGALPYAKFLASPATAVTVMDFIPLQFHADIIAGVSLVDLSQYINAATAFAGVGGLVMFPRRRVRGKRIQIYSGQTWIGFELGLPPATNDFLIVDNAWVTNSLLNTSGQNIQMNLVGSTPSNKVSNSRSGFSGTIAGNVLTVTFIQANNIPVATIPSPVYLRGDGLPDGLQITNQLSGTPKGIGTYQLNQALGAAVTVQWMYATDYFPGGVGWLLRSLNSFFWGTVRGFDTGLQPTDHNSDGSAIGAIGGETIYAGTHFLQCGAAIDDFGDAVTDTEVFGVIISQCGTYSRATMNLKTTAGWDFEGGKMFSNVGNILNTAARNFSMRNMNIQFNGSGYQDPALPAKEWDFIKNNFDPASYGTIEYTGNRIRFDCNAPQHTYKIFYTNTDGINDARMVMGNSFESELVPGTFAAYNLQCNFATTINLASGLSNDTYREDYTTAQKGNLWLKLGSPPALLAAANAAPSTAASPYTNPFVATAQLLGGNVMSDGLYTAYDAALGGMGTANLDIMDWFAFLATLDPLTALMNILSPAGSPSLAVNNPMFTPSRGFTGDGISQFINSQVAQNSGNATQDDCLIMAWFGDNQETNGSFGLGTSAGGRTRINPRNAGGNMEGRLNQNQGTDVEAVGSSIGSFAIMRDPANVGFENFYWNGALLGAPIARASTTIFGGFYQLLADGAATFSARTVQAGLAGRCPIGAGAGVLQIHNAVKPLIQFVGAPV